MGEFEDAFIGGVIGGAVGRRVAGRGGEPHEVAILFRHNALYQGGHPFSDKHDAALKPSTVVVREDGLECLRLQTRRFFVPAADLRAARLERVARRLAADEWTALIDYEVAGVTRTLRFRLAGFGPEDAARALAHAVEALVAQPHIELSAPPAAGSLDDLERLAELRDKGIITPEEFAAKKRQILGL